MSNTDLITDYHYEMESDHHNLGSGRYHVKVLLPADISPVFPYLNALLTDSNYDHENRILIGAYDKRRYAFRPHEIQAGMVTEQSKAPALVETVVELVNRVWRDKDTIAPSLKERSLPPVFTVYKLLPGNNCKECGYATCLACAADLRNGVITVDHCPPLSRPEHADRRTQILALFSSD